MALENEIGARPDMLPSGQPAGMDDEGDWVTLEL